MELAPWLLLGTLIAALLHGLLPQNFVQRHLQGKGGVPKPFYWGAVATLFLWRHPCGTGSQKGRSGSDGASVGFLISTPQTGVDSILVSASFWAGLLPLQSCQCNRDRNRRWLPRRSSPVGRRALEGVHCGYTRPELSGNVRSWHAPASFYLGFGLCSGIVALVLRYKSTYLRVG